MDDPTESKTQKTRVTLELPLISGKIISLHYYIKVFWVGDVLCLWAKEKSDLFGDGHNQLGYHIDPEEAELDDNGSSQSPSNERFDRVLKFVAEGYSTAPDQFPWV